MANTCPNEFGRQLNIKAETIDDREGGFFIKSQDGYRPIFPFINDKFRPDLWDHVFKYAFKKYTNIALNAMKTVRQLKTAHTFQ